MRGNVRTAMEQAIEELDARGMHVEMGHKEVGGIKPKIDDHGHIFDVCEQLELDWLFSTNPLQAADNELEARIVVREVFRNTASTFPSGRNRSSALPAPANIPMSALLLFSKMARPSIFWRRSDMKADFLSTIGYGFIMGILKNYEATNPFVSSTTDAFNRLKPGFEAPVCIVTSLGDITGSTVP